MFSSDSPIDWHLNYRVVNVPKGNGLFRKIYVVDKDSRDYLRGYLPYLEARLTELDTTGSNYAFTKGRNAALNALQHIGYRYTLSLDITDFFDSVKKVHVSELLDDGVVKDCLIDGSPRQGLPTSPLIATIAFLNCDRQIIAALDSLSIDSSYTRYADDLSISFDNSRQAGRIKVLIQQIVEDSGFKLNKKKSRLQSTRNGRVIITGIGVNNQGLHPTRKSKKKLRAAIHQGNIASARGLMQWIKCKLPKGVIFKHG